MGRGRAGRASWVCPTISLLVQVWKQHGVPVEKAANSGTADSSEDRESPLSEYTPKRA